MIGGEETEVRGVTPCEGVASCEAVRVVVVCGEDSGPAARVEASSGDRLG